MHLAPTPAAAQSLARIQDQRRDWNAASRSNETIPHHKFLLIGTPGTPVSWLEALKSIAPALEKTGRAADAARYREELRRSG